MRSETSARVVVAVPGQAKDKVIGINTHVEVLFDTHRCFGERGVGTGYAGSKDLALFIVRHDD